MLVPGKLGSGRKIENRTGNKGEISINRTSLVYEYTREVGLRKETSTIGVRIRAICLETLS